MRWRPLLTAVCPWYGALQEPSPEAVGDWEVAIRGPRTLNKFIYMDEPARIDALRPEIERRLGTIASLTQAQGNMLEVLPFGSSKGDGVKKLLNHVSVHPHEVLAIGDAENVCCCCGCSCSLPVRTFCFDLS